MVTVKGGLRGVSREGERIQAHILLYKPAELASSVFLDAFGFFFSAINSSSQVAFDRACSLALARIAVSSEKSFLNSCSTCVSGKSCKGNRNKKKSRPK